MNVNLEVTIFYEGDLIVKNIEVSSSERVGTIPELLGLAPSEGSSLKIVKHCTELGYDQIVGSVFDPVDVVDVFNLRESSGEGTERRGEKKGNFFNESDDEIILVVMNLTSHRPIFITGQLIQSVTFSASNFRNKVELYRLEECPV